MIPTEQGLGGYMSDHAVIAYVHPGFVRQEFAASLLGIAMNSATAIDGVIALRSGPNISRARNMATEMFMEDHDAPWLLMCDTDMWFPDDVLDRLVAAADENERPVVGALCFSTSNDGPALPTLYDWHDSPDDACFTPWQEWPEGECVRVDATGAACLLMHRGALGLVAKSAADPAAPWFRETSVGAVLIGEDLTFCLRCAAAGVPVHVHTGIGAGHVKDMMITEANRWRD